MRKTSEQQALFSRQSVAGGLLGVTAAAGLGIAMEMVESNNAALTADTIAECRSQYPQAVVMSEGLLDCLNGTTADSDAVATVVGNRTIWLGDGLKELNTAEAEANKDSRVEIAGAGLWAAGTGTIVVGAAYLALTSGRRQQEVPPTDFVPSPESSAV